MACQSTKSDNAETDPADQCSGNCENCTATKALAAPLSFDTVKDFLDGVAQPEAAAPQHI